MRECFSRKILPTLNSYIEAACSKAGLQGIVFHEQKDSESKFYRLFLQIGRIRFYFDSERKQELVFLFVTFLFYLKAILFYSHVFYQNTTSTFASVFEYDNEGGTCRAENWPRTKLTKDVQFNRESAWVAIAQRGKYAKGETYVLRIRTCFFCSNRSYACGGRNGNISDTACWSIYHRYNHECSELTRAAPDPVSRRTKNVSRRRSRTDKIEERWKQRRI